MSPPSATGTAWTGDCWSKIISLKLQQLKSELEIGFGLKFFFVCFWQTTLLFIVGELEQGGYVAVAVGVGDM